MDASRRIETPGWEMKAYLLLTAIAVARVSAFWCWFSEAVPTEWCEQGQMTPAQVVGCLVREKFWTLGTWALESFIKDSNMQVRKQQLELDMEQQTGSK